MYSIGQVAKMFNIPVSTLRYYDKEGLLPNLQRANGIRRFSDADLELLRVIECLKKTGLEIKDIKSFVEMIMEGPSSYGRRKELFETRRDSLLEEISRLERSLAMMKFKCWYYEITLEDGNEDRLHAMIPDGLPESMRALWDKAHEE